MLVGPIVKAQTAGDVPVKLPSGASDDQRYAWIDASLARLEPATQRWFGDWALTYALLATVDEQLAVVTTSPDQRAVSIVGGAGSVLGLVGVLMQPNSLSGSRARLGQFDASTALGKYERRRRAEYVLFAVASEERYWRSPVPHILAGVVTGAGGAVLMGYGLTGYAIVDMAVGMTIAELQIWTRPTRAIDAWRRYVDACDPARPAEVGPDQIDQFSVSLAVTPGGIAARGSF